jgi:hypothetical protein
LDEAGAEKVAWESDGRTVGTDLMDLIPREPRRPRDLPGD